MIIDVMCSCCGNHKKLSNERIQDTASLIHSGWGSCGSALYCPECSKSWKERNGNRQMADERNTFILVMNLFFDAKGGRIMECIDFMSYHCVTCKTLSRDLHEKCAVCEFNNGGCIDCVSVSTCAQRPDFSLQEKADEEA